MRILIAGIPTSPHTIRLANLLAGAGHTVLLAATMGGAPAGVLAPGVTLHLRPLGKSAGPAAITPAPANAPAPPPARSGPRVSRLIANAATQRLQLAMVRTLGHDPLARFVAASPPPLAAAAAPASTPGPEPEPVAIYGRPVDLPRVLPEFDRLHDGYMEADAPWLAQLIDTFQPRIVYSTTILQSGVLTYAARTLCRHAKPRWVVGLWGLDLDFFARDPMHREIASIVLRQVDFITAECERDIAIARALGFRGEELGVAPVGGGWDLDRVLPLRAPGPTSHRRVVLVKGYLGLVGRGFTAMRALALAADVLHEYEIVVFAAHADLQLALDLLAADHGLRVTSLPWLPYEELLGWFGRARCVIGLSASDALATTALEALVMGAIPIQSNSSCLHELLVDREQAMLVPAEDPVAVASAIRRVIADDAWVDAAVAENDALVVPALDARLVGDRILAMIDDAGQKQKKRKKHGGRKSDSAHGARADASEPASV